MAAYIIVQVNVTDPEKYTAYAKLTPASLEAFDGKFIVRGGATEDLEGRWEVPRLVILEFDTVERAKEWYDSPAYKKARSLREGGAEVTMTVVEGYTPA